MQLDIQKNLQREEADVFISSYNRANLYYEVRSKKETKKQLVLRALHAAQGNYIEAAKALGMHPNSLLRLIRTLDLKAAIKAIGKSGEQAVG